MFELFLPLCLSTLFLALVCGAVYKAKLFSSFFAIHSNTLLVIAHPDDECMFFSPLLENIANLHVLCLSNGNAEGIGKIREYELYKSCALFGIPSKNVRIVNDARLKDGMTNEWPITAIETYIENAINEWDISTIFTFDARGVSGHINHIACFTAVRSLQRRLPRMKPNAWVILMTDMTTYSLETVTLLRKYSAIFDTLLTLFTAEKILYTASPGLPYQAMLAHGSQFVWFRRLFILFSRYSYVNSFRRMQ